MPETFVDLSHTIEDGMITYKGLPAPIICDYLSREQSRARYAPGYEFQIGKIEMIANTGTYLDTPFHRYADGYDLSGLSLESVANRPGIALRAPWRNSLAVTDDSFHALGDIRGCAVLVHTGWDEHWRTDRYFEGHPFLTANSAQYLVDCAVALVGIDSHNIDDSSGGARPVHSILLKAGIPIVEHMTGLAKLPDREFRFTAVPPKIAGMGTFAVRAFATY
jgi:arylformamidase